MGQAGTYENEFKKILEGDREEINRVTKSMDNEQKQNYMLMEKYPFFVIRAAGSLGLADLGAMRRDISMMVEVKARSDGTFLSSHKKRYNQAIIEMIRTARRTGVLPIYAYRMKGYRGDAWRVFTPMKLTSLNGKEKKTSEILPAFETTSSDNFIMRWEDGMPLNKFLNRVTEPRGIS